MAKGVEPHRCMHVRDHKSSAGILSGFCELKSREQSGVGKLYFCIQFDVESDIGFTQTYCMYIWNV